MLCLFLLSVFIPATSSSADDNPAASAATTSSTASTPSSMPIVPTIDSTLKARLRTIYLAGQSAGNRSAVFAKAGDSITDTGSFLEAIGCNDFNLGTYTDLAAVITYFQATSVPARGSAWCGIFNSFSRASVVAVSGWSADYALSSVGGSVSGCSSSDSYLQCEMRLVRPSTVLIMYGTNDLQRYGDDPGRPQQGVPFFKANLTALITQAISAGVIPVLSTIPPRLDDATLGTRVALYNQAAVEVAQEQQIPLWNYWRATTTSPGMVNQGISTDGVHPNLYGNCSPECLAFTFTTEGMRYGYNQRNLTAVQVLKKIKDVIIDNGVPDAGGPTPVPAISSFSPTSGAVGASVTINGTNLSSATAVRFNGTTAAITSNTATQIVTSVPSGATSGTISVTTADGTANSSSSFTVSAPISSSEPPYNIGTPTLQEIFVAPSGNDGASGADSGHPVRTLAHAWDLASNFADTGYRINLLPGIYPFDGSNQFWDKSGTYSHPLIIRAYNGPGTATIMGGMDIGGASYLYFMDVNMVAGNPNPINGSGNNVLHIQASHHVLLKGVTLSGPACKDDVCNDIQETLKANQVQYMYVENSDISGAAWHALDFNVVQYGHILNSRIHNSGWHALLLKGGAASFWVEGNEIYDTNESGIAIGSSSGFEYMVTPFLHYETYDIKCINNIVHDTGRAGVTVAGSYNTLVAYNTFYRVGLGEWQPLISIFTGARTCDGDSATCTAYHNAGGWGPPSGLGGEMIPNRNVYIYNNIFYNPTASASTYFTISGSFTPPVNSGIPASRCLDSYSNIQIRGNYIWNNTSELGIPGGAPYNGCQTGSCTPSQLTSENTINSAQPQFVNFSGGDLRPQTGGNLFSATTYAIPGFAGGDRPTPPTAPVGNLVNTISNDRAGSTRSSSSPSGAYTGSTGVDAPTVSGFTPSSGMVGSSVVITGTNFTGANAVTFNGTSATFTVDSAIQITATVPAGVAIGPCPIAVTTSGGTATSATSFTVTVPAPAITSFSPATTTIGGAVIIIGTNFTGTTAVSFNGTNAAFYMVNSATQITANVAFGTMTGLISVTTPGGTAISSAIFSPDTDGDGLSDAQEMALGTDRLNPDSDTDTYNDGLEVNVGTDPLLNTSYPLVFRISADNIYWLYVNGVLKGNNGTWTNAEDFYVKDTDSLAVKVQDLRAPGGFIAEILNNSTYQYGTNFTWKATITAPSNWMNPSFDDRTWPFATEIAAYGQGVWGARVSPTLDARAKWIWLTTPGVTPPLIVYFRTKVENRNATVKFTCDNFGELLINGVSVLSASDWRYTYSRSTTLSPGNTLRISGGDARGQACCAGEATWEVGGVRSTLVTDSFWTGYVGSSTTPQNVIVAGSIGMAPWYWGLTLRTINASAKWIWAGDFYTVDNVGLERVIPNETLYFAADNGYTAYWSGVQIGSGTNWMQTGTAQVFASAGDVFSARVTDAGVGIGGFLAEGKGAFNFVSDASWSVYVPSSPTALPPVGWNSKDFIEDSQWVPVTSFGAYGIPPWGKRVAGFPTASLANWIWASDNNNINVSYLRKKIE